MKWFRSWLRKTLMKAVEEDNGATNKLQPMSTGLVAGVEENLSNRSIQFTMHFAQGGVVLQQYQYDHKTDRTNKKLIVIPDDQDVATVVGQHIALEMLRAS